MHANSCRRQPHTANVKLLDCQAARCRRLSLRPAASSQLHHELPSAVDSPVTRAGRNCGAPQTAFRACSSRPMCPFFPADDNGGRMSRAEFMRTPASQPHHDVPHLGDDPEPVPDQGQRRPPAPPPASAHRHTHDGGASHGRPVRQRPIRVTLTVLFLVPLISLMALWDTLPPARSAMPSPSATPTPPTRTSAPPLRRCCFNSRRRARIPSSGRARMA